MDFKILDIFQKRYPIMKMNVFVHLKLNDKQLDRVFSAFIHGLKDKYNWIRKSCAKLFGIIGAKESIRHFDEWIKEIKIIMFVCHVQNYLEKEKPFLNRSIVLFIKVVLLAEKNYFLLNLRSAIYLKYINIAIGEVKNSK
ncbi:hypothetical protein RFI_35717 [Reticulomyxa filosa]|uniref:Uncharacterized protein n=1 Tax=Reticulomyxa filosa TaxID=46433 RepID=X6LKQ8_RETFI|nr:hypothetical protein RFI_35717 [Reticulomyxa filosa]|eukprot:ETO01722.1 hypothetical protein RFI_35717 [Reticulomyxa filosa]